VQVFHLFRGISTQQVKRRLGHERRSLRGTANSSSIALRTRLQDILKRYRKEVTPGKKGCKQEKSRINVILGHPITKRSLAFLRSSEFATYRDERLRHVSGTYRHQGNQCWRTSSIRRGETGPSTWKTRCGQVALACPLKPP
jgi:hypothetical protein